MSSGDSHHLIIWFQPQHRESSSVVDLLGMKITDGTTATILPNGASQ